MLFALWYYTNSCQTNSKTNCNLVFLFPDQFTSHAFPISRHNSGGSSQIVGQ